MSKDIYIIQKYDYRIDFDVNTLGYCDTKDEAIIAVNRLVAEFANKFEYSTYSEPYQGRGYLLLESITQQNIVAFIYTTLTHINDRFTTHSE